MEALTAMRTHALLLLAALVAVPVQAAEVVMKPFVLAQRGPGEVVAVAAAVRAKVEAAGFQVAGTYQPYADATILAVTSGALSMKEIDFKPIRSTPHLPYEVLVSGGEVRALHARFRIAVNFPDLPMMGANSFMKISCAPDAIEDALKRMAGTKR
jgi:hypothetical protein